MKHFVPHPNRQKMKHFLVYHRSTGRVLWQSTTNAEYASLDQIWPGREGIHAHGKLWLLEECRLWAVPVESLVAQIKGWEHTGPAICAAFRKSHGFLRVKEDAEGNPSLHMMDEAERAAQARANRRADLLRMALIHGREKAGILAAIESGIDPGEFQEDLAGLEEDLASIRAELAQIRGEENGHN